MKKLLFVILMCIAGSAFADQSCYYNWGKIDFVNNHFMSKLMKGDVKFARDNASTIKDNLNTDNPYMRDQFACKCPEGDTLKHSAGEEAGRLSDVQKKSEVKSTAVKMAKLFDKAGQVYKACERE